MCSPLRRVKVGRGALRGWIPGGQENHCFVAAVAAAAAAVRRPHLRTPWWQVRNLLSTETRTLPRLVHRPHHCCAGAAKAAAQPSEAAAAGKDGNKGGDSQAKDGDSQSKGGRRWGGKMHESGGTPLQKLRDFLLKAAVGLTVGFLLINYDAGIPRVVKTFLYGGRAALGLLCWACCALDRACVCHWGPPSAVRSLLTDRPTCLVERSLGWFAKAVQMHGASMQAWGSTAPSARPWTSGRR